MSRDDFGGSVVPGFRGESLALTIHASSRTSFEEEEEFERDSPRIEPRRHKGVFSSSGVFRMVLPQLDLRRRASASFFSGWKAPSEGGGVGGRETSVGGKPPPELPFDVIRVILSYLDAEALCICAQVSTYWRSLADEDTFWFSLVLERFGVSSAQVSLSEAKSRRRQQL